MGMRSLPPSKVAPGRAIEGDSAFGFSGMELETNSAATGFPSSVIVLNNGGVTAVTGSTPCQRIRPTTLMGTHAMIADRAFGARAPSHDAAPADHALTGALMSDGPALMTV